jgi:hypothetical protein
MSTTPEKSSAPNGDGHGEGVTDDAAERLVAFAREYYSTAFPNPDRRDCPPPEKIRTTVLSGLPPNEGLSRHLFGCSECYNFYRALRAEREASPGAVAASQGAAVASRRSRLASAFGGQLGPRRWVLVGAAALAVVAFGWAVWRVVVGKKETAAHNAPVVTPTPSPAAEAPAPAPVGATPAPLIASASPPPRAGDIESDLIVRHVDLEAYAARRGAAALGDGGESGIGLPPARLRLTLTLPENSGADRYSVSLVNRSDQVIAAARARSHDGRRLTVNLDLRRLAGGSYRLRLARPGEPPEYYRVLIAQPQAKR